MLKSSRALIKRHLLTTVFLASFFCSGTVSAALITSPVQNNNLFFPNVLDFDFSGVPTALSDVTLSVFAFGDIGAGSAQGVLEGVEVGIGSTGGLFTSLGTFFENSSVLAFRDCNGGQGGLTCYEGTVNLLVGLNDFNALGSDITVRLTPTVAVDQVPFTEAQVTLSYDSGVIPAPATLVLLALGLVGLGWSRRKKA